jgi:hypothetical protein
MEAELPLDSKSQCLLLFAFLKQPDKKQLTMEGEHQPRHHYVGNGYRK